MKALSIIGIVISAIIIFYSAVLIDLEAEIGIGIGVVMLIGSLYFLAFSIVTTVKSFRKKKE